MRRCGGCCVRARYCSLLWKFPVHSGFASTRPASSQLLNFTSTLWARSESCSDKDVCRYLLDFSPADPVLALAASPTHPVPALVKQSPPVAAVPAAPAFIEQVHRLSPTVAVLENVLAYSENVGHAQQPQAGFMKRQHNPVDDVPGLWRVPLFGVLSPYYKVRNQQPSMCRLGSLYSGLCSESFALTQMQIPHVIKFTCDSKEAAYNFMKENGVIGELHFLNVTDLLNPERPARCIERDTGGELTEIFVPRGAFGELDVIVGGTSCRPNSAARTGRLSGAAPPGQHPEAFTTPAFIDMVALHEPRIALLENVLGMLCPESKQTTETPFSQLNLMQLCEEKTPRYSLCIFTLDHGIWMPWHRRRI